MLMSWKFGWMIGRYGYVIGGEINYKKLKLKAKDFLQRVFKGNVWKDRRGCLHVPIVVDNEIVGGVWNEIESKKLRIPMNK